MKTQRYYMARIPGTQWFIRCPRWFYNRWPWAGVVHIWDEPNDVNSQNTEAVATASEERRKQ